MKLDRRKALLVAERDFRDAAGDLRLALAMAGLAAVVPIAAGGGVRALELFGGGLSVLVERISVVGAFFVVFLPASYSLVLALESFVGERERSTLEVLLSTPLREAEIYAGRVRRWSSAPTTWTRRRSWRVRSGSWRPAGCWRSGTPRS